MARKHYAARTPSRPIRSSGAAPVAGQRLQASLVEEPSSAVHEFRQAQVEEASTEALDMGHSGKRNNPVLEPAPDPAIASLLSTREEMTPGQWVMLDAEKGQAESPELKHELDLQLDQVDKAWQKKQDRMSGRIESLKEGTGQTAEKRDRATSQASTEGVRPLREQRFESDLWLDRVVIDQLETSDNELHIRSKEEGAEISGEVDDLLTLHESGEAMAHEVKAEYRELRARQAEATEVAGRESFSQDKATMDVLDDYTPGERHPENSSDPRRIMAVVHNFNSTLTELLPLLSVEKERLPEALVQASEHLVKMIEIADAVLLYSGEPVFDEIPRQLMIDLAKGMEAAGHAEVQNGDLVERSDLGGWESMSVDDGTGKSPSAFEVLLGVDEQEVRDRISMFSLQVLQACGTGPTETMEFRDLNFPD
jgi:hypothetical protein